jgi:hypothetical protein
MENEILPQSFVIGWAHLLLEALPKVIEALFQEFLEYVDLIHDDYPPRRLLQVSMRSAQLAPVFLPTWGIIFSICLNQSFTS